MAFGDLKELGNSMEQISQKATQLIQENEELRKSLENTQQELTRLRLKMSAVDQSNGQLITLEPSLAQSSFTITPTGSKANPERLMIDEEHGTVSLPLEDFSIIFTLEDLESVYVFRHIGRPLITVQFEFFSEVPQPAPGGNIERYRLVFSDEGDTMERVADFVERLSDLTGIEDDVESNVPCCHGQDAHKRVVFVETPQDEQ